MQWSGLFAKVEVVHVKGTCTCMYIETALGLFYTHNQEFVTACTKNLVSVSPKLHVVFGKHLSNINTKYNYCYCS